MFRVAAKNAPVRLVSEDQYDWSEEVSITTPDVPQQVPSFTWNASTTAEARLRVNWTQVFSAALDVTDYVIRYRADGDPTWTDITLNVVSDLTVSGGVIQLLHDIDNLPRSNGPYRVTVAAKNVLSKTYDEDTGLVRNIDNDDLNFAPEQLASTFSAPDDVTNLAGVVPEDAGNTVDLTWDWNAASLSPEPNGGDPIRDYEAWYSVDGASPESWLSLKMVFLPRRKPG